MEALGLWYMKQGAPHVGFLVTEIDATQDYPSLKICAYGHRQGAWRSGTAWLSSTLLHFITAGELQCHPMLDTAGAAGLIKAFLAEAVAASTAQPVPHETHKRAQHVLIHDQELAKALAPVNWTLLSQISPGAMWGRIVIKMDQGTPCLSKDLDGILRALRVDELRQAEEAADWSQDAPAFRPWFGRTREATSRRAITQHIPALFAKIIARVLAVLPDQPPLWWAGENLQDYTWPSLKDPAFWHVPVVSACVHVLTMAERSTPSETRSHRTNSLVAIIHRKTCVGIEVMLPIGIIALVQLHTPAEFREVTATPLLADVTEGEVSREPPPTQSSAASSSALAIQQAPEAVSADIVIAQEDGKQVDPSWVFILNPRAPARASNEPRPPGPVWDSASLLPGAAAFGADIMNYFSSIEYLPVNWDRYFVPHPEEWIFRVALHPVLRQNKGDHPSILHWPTWQAVLANTLDLFHHDPTPLREPFAPSDVDPFSYYVMNASLHDGSLGLFTDPGQWLPSRIPVFPLYLEWVRTGQPRQLLPAVRAQRKTIADSLPAKGKGKSRDRRHEQEDWDSPPPQRQRNA
jgi:hypothetical protein